MKTIETLTKNNRKTLIKDASIGIGWNSYLVQNTIDDQVSRVHPFKHFKTLKGALKYWNKFLAA